MFSLWLPQSPEGSPVLLRGVFAGTPARRPSEGHGRVFLLKTVSDFAWPVPSRSSPQAVAGSSSPVVSFPLAGTGSIFFLWSWSHNEYTHSEQLFPHCYRQIVVNQYYLENFCDQLCTKQETRECNWQTCPINCLLGDYGPWSDCDPCVEKQVGDMWVYSGSRNHSKILEFPDRLNSHRNAEFLQYLKMNCPSFHCRKIPFSNMLGGKEDSFCMVSCHVNTKNNVLPPRIGIALAQL